jgi:molybdopterin-guanine dinucleotide biosynthesis protein B
MKIACITGLSGSGKTTIIEHLIRRYIAEGARVAAIKHTHHPLNEENRGDSARFLRAGAEPVILAGDGEAVVFRAGEAVRVAFAEAGDLLAHVDADIVLAEGQLGVWPRVRISSDERPSPEEVASILDRIWRS